MSSVAARLALSGALIAACASAATAQSYGTAPYPPSYPASGSGGVPSDDPIQEGRDGMHILGTITVAPGAPAPSTSFAPSDEDSPGTLSADHMAWSLAAKNAYAAHQYTEARSLFRRAAQGGDAQAEMMLGQMAERGQGGPQDLEEALGWYASAANKGVSGASQKVASITDTLRRQAAQSIAAGSSSDEKAKPQPAKPAAHAPASRNTATASGGHAKSTQAPQPQKAESLTPRPAPEVTADAEPLADPAAQQADREKQAAEAKKKQEQAEKQKQAEQARQQAEKQKQEEQARQQAEKQKQEEQARQQAERQKQDEQAQQQARADERQVSAPEWPAVPAAQPTRATQDERTDRPGASSRGNSGDEQEASLPDSLQAPTFSEFAPLPKRRAPPLNADAKAKLDQARAFESGKGVTKNEAKAIDLYKSIADQSTEAAFDLGWRYAAGRGVKRDDKESVRYYRMAAEKGYPPAQNNLGGMLADGRGVKKDEDEAVDWYRRAALQDFAPAQVNLALMYGKGRGLPQSDANAMAWYSRAAKSGYGPATASLAMMYSQGKGVPQDQKTADFLMESAKGASPASALVSVEP